MKRLFTVLAVVLLTTIMWAQNPPQKMSYQAVIRDADKKLVITQVGMRISILQGSETGTPYYVETQTPTPNANGLVSIEIGTGTSTDDFSAINWANGPYFIKTETDPDNSDGLTDYTITGTSQLLSVPYALHSKTGENVTGIVAIANGGTGAISVSGAKTSLGLGNVDNTTDLLKPVSTATQTALDLKAPLASPTFTGTVAGITSTMVGLGNVDNTTDLLKPVSTATQTALDLKAPLASPTFTGTVTGITSTMVGLGNVDNTTDLLKPVSTATQTALDLKAPLASPTFTGTVVGITSAMVGLANVDNTTDANKPVSTATQTALNLKVDKVTGKGLSTNDYTTVEQTKLAAITGTNTGDDAPNTLYSGLVTNATHTGDVTGSGALTLATVNSNVGTFNNITINAKGLATAGSNVSYLTSETDPIYVSWNKSTGINITASQVSDFQTSVTNNAEVLANTAKNSYPTSDQMKLAGIAEGANVGVVPNTLITGATKTKITYDAKGLVTAGTDATTVDIAASTDKNYVTDAQLTVIGNTSGTNTGDNTINTLYSGLVTNATHTGDATGSEALTLATVNSNVGTFNNITINAKGLATAGSNVSYLTSEADPIVKAITGIVKSNGATISAATAGTDYLTPTGSAASLTGFPTLNQNTTGSAASFTGSLAGDVTGTQGATVVGNAAVIGKVLTGYVSGAGTVAATDNILQAIQKLNGNTTHIIGESYGGGKVFYVYDNGQHGLIAATSDQSAGIRWYGGSATNTRARADGVGAGLKNTAIIIANQGPVDGNAFAATVCNEYSVTVGGVTYGDWYLPSKYELNLLYLQRAVVGGFTSNYYLSSTEYSSDRAWAQIFSGGLLDYPYKYTPNYVRAIRAF